MKRIPATIVVHLVGVIIALLIQPWTSQWMDMVSIYICPFGAALAGVMFFWVMKKQTALDAINDLVKARMIDPSAAPQINLAGSELLSFIRHERSKELMGEGFRLSDLRRWKQGFNRNQPYELNPLVAASRSINGLNVVYDKEDYRYVWAIPQAEMDINPNLAGQQNPGYGK